MTLRFVLYRLVDFYELLILAECILSWVALAGGDMVRDIYEAISRITEPFVGIFLKLIPSIGGGGMGIDFSPMIAIIVLDLLKRLIFSL